MPRSMLRPASTLALLLALAACGGEHTPAPSVAQRDSAGVALVDLSALAPPTQAQLLVDPGPSPDPTAPIGSIVDGAFGPGGELVLLDGQAATVRVLGPDGAPLRTLSGPGEGPTELSTLATAVVVRADTVEVSDWTRARWVRSTLAGEALDPRALPVPPPSRSWWQAGADGQLYGRSLRRVLDEDGAWGGEDLLLRASGEGVDTVGAFEYPPTDLGGQGAARIPLVINAPMWAVLPDGAVVWSSLDRSEVLVGLGGGIRVRAPTWTARAPSASEGEVLLERMGERLRSLGGSEQTLEILPVDQPERFPALTAVAADGAGVVWVQRFDGVDALEPNALNTPETPAAWGGPVWDRFQLLPDAEVRVLPPVRLDVGVRILDIVDDRVLVAHTDELGRVSPRVYRVPSG